LRNQIDLGTSFNGAGRFENQLIRTRSKFGGFDEQVAVAAPVAGRGLVARLHQTGNDQGHRNERDDEHQLDDAGKFRLFHDDKRGSGYVEGGVTGLTSEFGFDPVSAQGKKQRNASAPALLLSA
jgi:hypothetical protein